MQDIEPHAPSKSKRANVEVVQNDPFAGITTQAIETKDALDAIIPELEAANTIGFDTETTGLDFLRNQLHGISVATETKEWYICGPALFNMLDVLKTMGKNPDKLWVLHNAKFDLHFLKQRGVDLVNVADTMIGWWLINENDQLGLKPLSEQYLGMGKLPSFSDLQKVFKQRLGKKRMDEITIFDIPSNILADYAARDARLTLDLWKKVQYGLDQEGMTDIFWKTEMPFMRVLLDMEENGMYVDPAALNDLDHELAEKSQEALARWEHLAPGVNPNSCKQLQTLLFTTLKLKSTGKTAGGADAVDALHLQRLVSGDKSGTVSALLDLRMYEKLKTTYVGFLREKPVENRVHGSFNQCGCETGRMSSSDPNLQNIPSRGPLGKKVRGVFGAGPGTLFVDIDYSQIELRAMASDANEPKFLKVFEEGGDPHQMTADLAHVTRQIGKTLNFGVAYGSGPGKLCDIVEKAGEPRPRIEETRVWLANFRAAYPRLESYKAAVKQRTRELGYVITMGGRKRRLPDINSFDESLRSAAERQAVNSRIQGSCADMLKWAMIQVHPYCNWFDAKITAQVHDELTFEVPVDAAEEFGRCAQKEMESIKEKFNLRVKIIAEPAHGANWAATH